MRKFVLVMILLLSFAALGFAQEATETPEDVPSVDFPTLVSGEAVEAEFTTSSMQIYTFLGTAGDEVSAELLAAEGSELDPFLVILGPNGEVVGYNDDADGLNAVIESAELPVDGIYLVLATTYYEMETQTTSEESPLENNGYSLTVSGFNEPAEVTAETTQLRGYSVESAEDGSISITGDMTIVEGAPVTYIFFAATEGQTISLVSAGSDSETALIDPLMYLFAADGSRLAAVDDTEDGALFPSIEVVAPEDGIYLAFVTSYGFETANDEEGAYAGYGDVNVTLEVK